ncbi:Ser/Thr protein kinase RdoA involved in Cpx stress response, MazF antagonist [Friedmanniella luteola]|uniref:Ser/Thr protein kinase RdoA involved in Cpx stress response, MazF antagonist n=1 Tax=Friedmanniella luteola TaxID=546871 RepID=A0A1H1S1B9_9ACTN|nr:phosphotransferase [Friedmanniella luteola]SDS41009.1 Ser/Thr protein kinase RdoA involved in Cpx stress response, MazF antagonist [Friedmanniella luteola]
MTDPTTPWPPLRLDDLAREAVRAALGPGARVDEVAVLQSTPESAVLRLAVHGAAGPLVLKLAATSAGPALDLGRTAAVMRRAAAAGVPVPAVLAADASGRLDGVQHLLQEHVPGRPWREVRPLLDDAAVRAVHAAVAAVLAALSTVRPAGFGELDGDGEVRPVPLAEALRRRVALRTRRPAARALAERLVAEHPDRLGAGPPVLSHDDLHHQNVLVDPASARLVAVLDWDKAWAGPAASDRARVRFWDDMTGPGPETDPEPAGDDDVHRLHQLLWCLEHAFPTARHRADTARLLRSFDLPVPADLG